MLLSTERLHPLLPTRDEVSANPDLAYSDHLPQLLFITIRKEKKAELHYIQIGIWNVLATNTPSGIHHQTAPDESWETEAQANARYQRISRAILSFFENYELLAMCLQEATEAFFKVLSEAGHEKYGFIRGEGGLITMYPITPLSETYAADLTSKKDQYNRHCQNHPMQSCLTVNFGGNMISLHNVHTAHSELPNLHEAFYKELLNEHDQRLAVFVVGDTNSRFARPQISLSNIITRALPQTVNQQFNIPLNVQLGDFSDGGFAKPAKCEIEQLDSEILDYTTGMIADATTSNVAAPRWAKPRMFLQLDATTDNCSLLALATLRKIAQKLPVILQDRQFQIRETVQDNNSRGYAFCCTSQGALHNILKRELANEVQFTFNTIQTFSGESCCILEIPNDILLLKLANIVDCYKRLLTMIEERIALLRDEERSLSQKLNPLIKSPTDKIKVLTVLLEQLTGNKAGNFVSITTAWSQSTPIEGKADTASNILAQARIVAGFFGTPKKNGSGKDQPPKSAELLEAIARISADYEAVVAPAQAQPAINGINH